MSDAEMDQILHSDNPAVVFTQLWTRKEAAVKRSGYGISNDMKHVLEGLPFEISTVLNIEKHYVYSITL
jgi:4'-phosphopantetheinyl transferase